MIEFGVLGQLEIHVDGQPVALRAPALRRLLAVLLCHSGQPVSIDDIADALWDEAPTPGARRTLHVYVHRLRKALGEEQRVTCDLAGYRIEVDPHELDALRFGELTRRGRAARRQGQVAQAGDLFTEALSLWRGRPYADIAPSNSIAAEVHRLEEQRLLTVQARIEVDLDLGRHAQLVPELTTLTETHPYRERLRALLMLALYRSGRQAEALEVYRQTRARLADELGVDPDPLMQRLHGAMLRADDQITKAPVASLERMDEAANSPPVRVDLPHTPRELPADISAFTGRNAAQLDLVSYLTGAPETPVPIVVIAGPAGVGKSALAVRVAHKVADRFPDGQLYVDLQGATEGAKPLSPMQVLDRFLRALGVDPGHIPRCFDTAAARFRSESASRRLLLVLDNARDAGQVAPLLPGASGCAVLVTSREMLTSLPNAHRLLLDGLPPTEAVQLLAGLAGTERIAANPAAAAKVARLCAHLPLALRIAGAKLAARPRWSIDALAERLADPKRRLDELQLPDIGVRASFAVSYQDLRNSDDLLDREAADAFTWLGAVEATDITATAAGWLLDRTPTAAESALERLVDANLLHNFLPDRYRPHDLLRLYARECAAELPESARQQALERLFGGYLASAWHSMRLLRPGDRRRKLADDRWLSGGLAFPDVCAALAWLDAEQSNLLAAARQASALPGPARMIACQLAPALFGYLIVRAHWSDLADLNQAAIDIAAQSGSRAAYAQALNDLGIAYFQQGEYREALTHLRESLEISRQLTDLYAQGAVLNNIGSVYLELGEPEEARRHYEESLVVRRRADDSCGQARSADNLASAYHRLKRYDEAIAHHEKSLAQFRALGDRHSQATCLGNLSETYRAVGRREEALACLRESMRIQQELGDRDGRAENLRRLGALRRQQGRHAEALACLRDSLACFQEMGMPYGVAQCLREIGATLEALGEHTQAREHWQEALEIHESLNTRQAHELRSLLTTP